jgi:hypothetical protein
MDRPKGMPKSKKKYYIMLDGRYVGESWAVSPRKAISNWWWKNVKEEDEFSPRDYDPEDFDAVEAE